MSTAAETQRRIRDTPRRWLHDALRVLVLLFVADLVLDWHRTGVNVALALGMVAFIAESDHEALASPNHPEGVAP